ERFIDGREFNIAVLEVEGRPRILPMAEMVFAQYGPERRRIVDYAAKWHPESFNFSHTVRRFDFDSGDAPLLGRLRRLTEEVWSLFGARGYARVDFRVDGEGVPWILEINVNPCLAADAGYMAAANRSGLELSDVVRYLVDAALATPSGVAS
ncbi:MAG: D-alanine--D-alanine ligase, partial [Magnetococcales bacterium]|nr:D-alanine--D-alanine ligase [Magnetococcales bacterium]